MGDFFDYNKRTLSYAGIWPYPNEKSKQQRHLILAYFNNFLNVFTSIAEFLYTAYNLNNIVNFSEGLCIFITGVQNIMKNSLFIVRRKLFWQLLLLLDDLYENTPLPNTNELIQKSTMKWKHRSQNVVKLMLFVYNVTIISYLLVPWYIYYRDGIRVFPFPTHYPFDTSSFAAYFAMYISQFILGYLLWFVFSGCDSFFCSVIFFMSSRIEVLIYCLEVATTESVEEQIKTPMFNVCIEYHQTLLGVFEIIEDYFSPMLLVQFFISTIAICTLFFLSTLSGIPLERKFAFTSYLVALTTQLFIYCFFGQLIQTKFEEFEKIVTYYTWYDAPLQYQKDMMFFLARCAKPMVLTAYKIMPVNLASFVSIYKTSISYLAMLKSMQDDE